MLTREKTAAASFCDSPYHLSVKDDTCKLIKRQPEIKGEGTEGKSKIGHLYQSKKITHKHSYRLLLLWPWQS